MNIIDVFSLFTTVPIYPMMLFAMLLLAMASSAALYALTKTGMPAVTGCSTQYLGKVAMVTSFKHTG